MASSATCSQVAPFHWARLAPAATASHSLTVVTATGASIVIVLARPWPAAAGHGAAPA
jgi:hypothetical protein